MRIFHKSILTAALVSGLVAASGCRAQVPPGKQLSPDLARRVEVLIRQRTKLSPEYLINVGERQTSDIPGFDKLLVTFTAEGQTSQPLTFLLSTDGKTLAQFNKYDISKDPKALVPDGGRPSRGGPESAPVEIVAFDDLECPFCTRMHTALFPALTDRYGSSVRVVYRDFPLSIHPWAMRAAINTNCVAAQSVPAYWSLVDYIHAHAGEIGLPEKSIDRANTQLDQLAADEAKKKNLNAETLAACIKKQDDSTVKASMKLGDDLGIEATPVLFINGEKLEGAYPIADVFRMVDSALTAAGKTPPPPYVAPAPPLVTPPATK